MTKKPVPKKAWLDIGLKTLTVEGPDQLTIDQLCKKVGRSKGSFYFHFDTIEAYKSDLVGHWSEIHTAALEAEVLKNTSVREKRLAVPGFAARLDSGVERAIRVWAHKDHNTSDLIRLVDQRRIAFVAELIRDVNGLDQKQSQDLATIEYAAFLGFLQLNPEASAAWREQMFTRVLQLISPNVAKPE